MRRVDFLLPGAAPCAELVADRWKGLAEPGSKSWSGLDAIAAADPSFSGAGFVQGARKAYEAVVGAFAKGDRNTLRNLLSKDVFENFLVPRQMELNWCMSMRTEMLIITSYERRLNLLAI